MAVLYLFASPLAGVSASGFFSLEAQRHIVRLRHVVCERIRSTRRLFRGAGLEMDLGRVNFLEIGKHADAKPYASALGLLRSGQNVGLFSEAGVPVLADPGARLIALCHKHAITVRPCLAESAILSALIASGFPAQQFTFHGYSPIHPNACRSFLMDLERQLKQRTHTHIWIETPFRSRRLFDLLMNTLRPNTTLCVASHLHTPKENIKTMPIHAWKQQNPDLHKTPAVFLLGHLAID